MINVMAYNSAVDSLSAGQNKERLYVLLSRKKKISLTDNSHTVVTINKTINTEDEFFSKRGRNIVGEVRLPDNAPKQLKGYFLIKEANFIFNKDRDSLYFHDIIFKKGKQNEYYIMFAEVNDKKVLLGRFFQDDNYGADTSLTLNN